MNEHVPGSKIAERMLARPEGATMSELIAATGGPQYNVLKRLKASGRTIRETRDGRGRRYHLVAETVERVLPVSDKGQVTLPKEWRDALGIDPDGAVKGSVRNGEIVLRRRKTLKDLYGILHRPGMRAVTIEEMDEGIAQAVSERYLRSLPRRKRK